MSMLPLDSTLQNMATSSGQDNIAAAEEALLDQMDLPLLTIDIRHNSTLNREDVRTTIQRKCQNLPRPIDISKLIAFIDDDTKVSADEVELCADGDPGQRVLQR